jgi:hypothetical protein
MSDYIQSLKPNSGLVEAKTTYRGPGAKTLRCGGPRDERERIDLCPSSANTMSISARLLAPNFLDATYELIQVRQFRVERFAVFEFHRPPANARLQSDVMGRVWGHLMRWSAKLFSVSHLLVSLALVNPSEGKSCPNFLVHQLAKRPPNSPSTWLIRIGRRRRTARHC